MRKHASTSPLVGQLLFAEEGPDIITLDWVLTRAGSDSAAVPVTFEVRFPGRERAAAALDMLDHWAARGAEVEVMITEGDRGPEVEITSGATRLLLEPEH